MRGSVASSGLGVLDFRAGAQVEPPVEHQAQCVENRETVHGHLWRSGLDLVANYHRGDEGAIAGYCGGPAQHGAGLLAVKNNTDGSER